MAQKPHLTLARVNLFDCWRFLGTLFPDPAQFDCPSQVALKNKSDPDDRESIFRKVKTVFIDNIVESDWKKQCDGKFGGPKPQFSSWKWFYAKSEHDYHQLADTEDQLRWAVANGHFRTLQTLLEEDDDITPEMVSRLNLLYTAVVNRYPEVVSILLSTGGAVNVVGEAGWTPLIWSAFYGDLDMVELMIDRSADINHKDASGCTALHWAAIKGHSQVIEMLLAHGATPNTENDKGALALYLALYNDHYRAAETILQYDANLDATDECGRTLLHWTASNGRTEMAQLLLSIGANPNIQDEFGRTPLHWATQFGFFDLVVKLVEAGATIEITDKFGDKPMILAAQSGHPKLVSFLFEQSAQPN